MEYVYGNIHSFSQQEHPEHLLCLDPVLGTESAVKSKALSFLLLGSLEQIFTNKQDFSSE